MIKKKKVLKRLLLYGSIFCVIVLIKMFIVTTYYVPSGSMLPTIPIGNSVVVDKLAFRLGGSPEEGEIVVFNKPTSDIYSPGVKILVKRVVGLPGQTISSKHGVVYINGVSLKEPFLPHNDPTTNLPPTIIPQGDVYVLGDNRNNSVDSRYFGPLPINLIIGKVVAILPLPHL